MTLWPKQSDVLAYRSAYGDPRGRGGSTASAAWQKANLTTVSPPFKMAMGSIPITKIVIHKACAESLSRVLNAVWGATGKDQKKIEALHVSVFSGSFNYRPMRGLSTLSMHSFGCAIDFDAPNNGLHQKSHFFQPDHPLVKAFEAEGWTWGGRWPNRTDAMHFQASNV